MAQGLPCKHNCVYRLVMDFVDLPAGLSLVEEPMRGIKVDTQLCTGLVLEHGAHVVEWTPKSASDPVLWMSEKSDFADDKPIRGGVPIVYPWFGPGRKGTEQPGHGFGRLAPWRLMSAKVTDRGAAHLVFQMNAKDDSLLGVNRYPEATVELHLSMGSVLQMSLVVTAREHKIDFEEGLHTYFTVGDVRKIKINGLDGEPYTDNLTGKFHRLEGDLTFHAETDIRFDTVKNPRIVDEELARVISIESVGASNVVVWNPWVDKSKAMPDFGDDDWPGMVCVEVANARSGSLVLAPGERHVMSQVITVREI